MFSALIKGFGTAAGDLAQAAGDAAAQKDYTQAETIAEQNAQVSKESTAIQQVAAQRQIFQTEGAQQAQVGGAGFAAGGSAGALLRSSAQQGSLTHQLLQTQGVLNVNSYEEQAAAYKAQASAAGAAGAAADAGAATSAITGVLGFFGL